MKFTKWTPTFKNMVVGNGSLKAWSVIDEDANTIHLHLEFKPGTTSELLNGAFVSLPPEIDKLFKELWK